MWREELVEFILRGARARDVVAEGADAAGAGEHGGEVRAGRGAGLVFSGRGGSVSAGRVLRFLGAGEVE